MVEALNAGTPLVLDVGDGHLSGAAKALNAFAEAQSLRAARTMTGNGAITFTHPLSAGMLGRDDRTANELIARSDGLLVAGCKLGEMATRRFPHPLGVPLIHLDLVAEEFGRNPRPYVVLWGDRREGLRDLADALAGNADRLQAERADCTAGVKACTAKWRAEVDDRLTSDESPIKTRHNPRAEQDTYSNRCAACMRRSFQKSRLSQRSGMPLRP